MYSSVDFFLLLLLVVVVVVVVLYCEVLLTYIVSVGVHGHSHTHLQPQIIHLVLWVPSIKQSKHTIEEAVGIFPCIQL